MFLFTHYGNFEHPILKMFMVSVASVAQADTETHLVIGALEVDEHFPDEDAPAAPRMAVLDLGEPALQCGLVVLFTQQQLGGVSS